MQRAAVCLLASLLFALALGSSALANGYESFTRRTLWSPDGAYCAALQPGVWSNVAGGDDYTALIFASPDGEQWYSPVYGMLASPSFSPDSRYFIVLVNGDIWLFEKNAMPPPPKPAEYNGIDEHEEEGSPYYYYEPYKHLAVLTSSHDLLDCAWAGSETIVFSRGERFYGAGLFSMSWPGQSLSALSATDEGLSEWGIAVSPDGMRIAYSAQGDERVSPDYERLMAAELGRSLLTEHRQTSTSQDGGQWGYHESWPLWEDNARLLFQRGGWGDWSLYRLQPDGTEQLALRGASQASIGGNGRWLAFTRRDPLAMAQAEYDWELPAAVWLHDQYDRMSRRFWQLSDSSTDAQYPALSPDGQHIAWLERTADDYSLLRVEPIEALLASREVQILEPNGGRPEHYLPYSMEMELPVEDEVSYVVLETTKGDVVLECHSAWSPAGYAHFLELVRLGFYDGAPWFRVIEGFVAQCGIASDPLLNREWENRNIPDDPVIKGNQRGYVAYGMTGDPNSRSTHIYINYGDNSRLDERGFCCFAVVTEGMEVADSFTRIEDAAFAEAGLTQELLAVEGGMALLAEKFPQHDSIVRAYVRE